MNLEVLLVETARAKRGVQPTTLHYSAELYTHRAAPVIYHKLKRLVPMSIVPGEIIVGLLKQSVGSGTVELWKWKLD